MEDTQSMEIKRLLKKVYPTAQFQVWIHKYSMGESINVRTDLIKSEKVADAGSYTGYSAQTTEEGKKHRGVIEKLLSKYKSVDRDQWGEILSGGNTFLFVGEL